MSPQTARKLFAASASPFRREALSFFRNVSDLREGHRTVQTVQERRWRRGELVGIALYTDRPAILRRCEQALATERARRVSRVQTHRGLTAPTVRPAVDPAGTSNVVPFKLRQMPAVEPQRASEA